MSVATRHNLVIIDDKAVRHRFVLAPTGRGGRGYIVDPKPWEPGDPRVRWRIPLHPFDGGLNTDRLTNRRTYAKANADSSFPSLLLPPPKVNTLTLANATAVTKAVEFNGDTFVLAGRYCYKISSSDYSVTEDKDFGIGKAAVDAAVFNGELIVAMGESEKIWKRDTSGTWTQATDNVYAIALGVVGSQLWRAHDTNQISNTLTAPLTLANYTPADPNEYTVSDTTDAIVSIIDYGGVPWVGKANGMFAPDAKSDFHNQLPQAMRWPHSHNCKYPFVAWGALWVPTVHGLYRLRPSEAHARGPEKAGRPDYAFLVFGGVEFGEAVYLLCQDRTGSEETVIIKMVRDEEGYTGREYRYYEWCRLGSTDAGGFIHVSANPANPTLYAGIGTNTVKYIKLGRGGHRDIDDASYEYGTSMELETGPMLMGPDLSMESTFVGVSTLLDYSSAGESLTVSYKIDGDGSFKDLLSTQEGGGVAPIQMTKNYETVTRYAPPNTKGQFLDIKFSGSLTSAAGTNRPEIREAWAFGYSNPRHTDHIMVAIVADHRARSRGIRTGKSREEVARQFRKWLDDGTVLRAEIQDYEESRPVRVIVRSVQEIEERAEPGTGGSAETVAQVRVELVRVDYAKGYAA